jgi:ubiquinone biosynthesis protein UbiJ
MLLAKLEEILNRNVAQSAKARALIGRLEGRSLALTLDGTPFSFLMRIADGSIHVSEGRGAAHAADRPDAEIRGTPLALASLAGRERDDSLRAGAVRISGDAEIAQAFRELLRHAQPDAEEELAGVVGDVTAHQLGSFARGVLGWGRKAADTVATSVAEYLQEEGRDVPTRIELEEFLRGVDTLRNDVERLEARLKRLGARRGIS